MRRRRRQWFARGGGVKRMGPYATQEEAAAALLTVEGRHADGAFVWPEAVDDKEQRELVKEVCNG